MNSNPEAIETIALQLQHDLSAMKDAKSGQEHLLVTTLSRTFGVDINEVALYRLDHERSVLKFLWPEKLKSIGAIPFSSFDSLAARTAREGVVLIENAFASQRHANAFEKVRLASGVAPPPKPIQKIISAPIIKGEEICGVIQLSRKGTDNGPHIQDFTDSDAEALMILAGIFADFF